MTIKPSLLCPVCEKPLVEIQVVRYVTRALVHDANTIDYDSATGQLPVESGQIVELEFPYFDIELARIAPLEILHIWGNNNEFCDITSHAKMLGDRIEFDLPTRMHMVL